MAKSNAEKQKEYKERKWTKVLEMPKIPCECGCGTMIPPFTRLFEPARFARGHGAAASNKATRFKKGQKPWNAGIKAPSISEGQKGKPKSPESIAKRTATRRAKNGGVYQTAKGWKHTPETIENMRVANQANAKFGEANHFFGKRHTDESKARMSAANSGENHPNFGKPKSEEAKRKLSESIRGEKHWNWKGGSSHAPYSLEFSSKLKRSIRKRDKYTCQRCGVTQGELEYWIHVHHLDFNKANNSHDNLVCACASCNIWANYHPDEPFINPDVWARTHDAPLEA